MKTIEKEAAEATVPFPKLVAKMAANGENTVTASAAIGMDDQAFRRRLAGKVEWSLLEIRSLCEHFGCDFDDLF